MTSSLDKMISVPVSLYTSVVDKYVISVLMFKAGMLAGLSLNLHRTFDSFSSFGTLEKRNGLRIGLL